MLINCLTLTHKLFVDNSLAIEKANQHAAAFDSRLARSRFFGLESLKCIPIPGSDAWFPDRTQNPSLVTSDDTLYKVEIIFNRFQDVNDVTHFLNALKNRYTKKKSPRANKLH